MVISRRVAAFLLVAGGFQWLVWPNFLRVVWRDKRAFHDGAPTAFLLVHIAIVVPALLLGTALLVLGMKAWRRAPGAGTHESGRDRVDRVPPVRPVAARR